jgi:hypothetical protein
LSELRSGTKIQCNLWGVVLIKNYWIFESKSEEKEVHPVTGDEVTYQPWGVIVGVQWPLTREDGEVLAVVYRSPCGQLYKTWKQLEEVEISETSKREWVGIHDLILWDDANPEGAPMFDQLILH